MELSSEAEIEVLVISPRLRQKPLPKIQSLSLNPYFYVKNLGIIFDSVLAFIPHIENMTEKF